LSTTCLIPDDVASAMERGDALPATALGRYPLPEQTVPGDRGINVLLDLAHHCYMGAMWGLAGRLNDNGFRCVSSHACLDTVLQPGEDVLVRTLAGEAADGKKVRPFIQWPNTEYNVVLTIQADAGGPLYTDVELEALGCFVAEGGGVIVLADINGNGSVPAWGKSEDWPLRTLLSRYGAEIEGACQRGDQTVPAFALSSDWEAVLTSDDGRPVAARKTHGRGRLVLVASLSMVHHPLWTGTEQTAEQNALRTVLLTEAVEWAAGGREPVSGETRLPDTHGGAGGIYPERRTCFGNIHVYYASNQLESVLQTVEVEYPRIQQQILDWLPSPLPADEPLLILLGAGTGGGWAVNAFYPKENGIISTDAHGLIGIFAHEFAHILSGPRNALGEVAANWFDGNQGEAHAGFFQGRIWGMSSDNHSMRDCNSIFDHEKEHGVIDLGVAARDGYKAYGGGGQVWRKLWYVWQKLDDRYGTTWYPRWRWVQHTRWQDASEKALSLNDTVEDMSIAVGEDLFPFLAELGTTLIRERLERISFQGKMMELPVAPLEATPAGDVRTEPITDYTKPLTREQSQ
jgi:hypothetical protein